jgi:hypothetical protein
MSVTVVLPAHMHMFLHSCAVGDFLSWDFQPMLGLNLEERGSLRSCTVVCA